MVLCQAALTDRRFERAVQTPGGLWNGVFLDWGVLGEVGNRGDVDSFQRNI
ncbi:hypothetical protein SBF1_1470003 [Candidatus Desulfosporosinus infrequens]|uniref:Uncharacterized protein n=1 Tax=Candidatus Desulfosporosinus infrequens TaxID=2043169 RepID=A0A2U3K6H9_9FIRM|nr:hypothetical protein SBF1_1470003 [Candidatus Desulfosporosinus infrequens]